MKTEIKKPKPRKFHFIQSWGSYGNETLVLVGLNFKETLAVMRKGNFNQAIVDAFARRGAKAFGDDDASAWTWHRPEFGATILWFPNWENDWEHIETLIHECHHLIFFMLGERKGMVAEPEAQAYQMEYLFHGIRKGMFKRVKGKTK